MWNVISQRSMLIREPNEVRILRLVRDHKEISRVEIAKKCNLNKAYVTELVAKLIKTGFLEETGKVEINGKVGRKRTLLRFLPLAGLVAGVDVGMTHATIILCDLNAALLQSTTFHYALETTPQEVFKKVQESIQHILQLSGHPQSKLVGIGIGVQGLINYATNSLTVSHNKKSWEGESMSAELEKTFKVPIYVENDVKTMALGEYLLGVAKGVKNFVYLYIGDGLGAGIMINGHMHRGFTSSAGEIGYTELEPASHYKEICPMLYNGQIIFGQILTDANIVESFKRHSKLSEDVVVTPQIVAGEAEKGNSIAIKIIDECATLLSILSINLINTLNPEMIILGGKFSQCCPQISNLIREKIHKDLLSIPVEAVQVKSASFGDDSVAKGAASVVLFEMFEPLHTFSVYSPRTNFFSEV
ncbi:MAG: ROK family transcriptional regulator [Bacteroidetes bacterium]|nr:ROK family transcriptional regulator [Bacteroidota bacterium]